jgi:hypothetical protein
MSSALDLLMDLDRRGITLTAPDPDQLVAAPGSFLPPADREAIRLAKPALLTLLAGGFTPEAVVEALANSPPDWDSGPVQLVERELVSLDGQLAAFDPGFLSWVQEQGGTK